MNFRNNKKWVNLTFVLLLALLLGGFLSYVILFKTIHEQGNDLIDYDLIGQRDRILKSRIRVASEVRGGEWIRGFGLSGLSLEHVCYSNYSNNEKNHGATAESDQGSVRDCHIPGKVAEARITYSKGQEKKCKAYWHIDCASDHDIL
ncbi:MAG: lactococcin 972 family bacteriocin [Oscillospiraceae bacterium]|nr:lactococcin 972 family bacteriocin [Oscillospiraceae bacterium]